MKTLSVIRNFTLLLIGAFSILTSCIKDETFAPKPSPVIVDGMAEISFMTRVPAATVIMTRGETGIVAENRINDIHVLVFKTTGELVYRGKGKNVTASGTNDNTVAFKATLPLGETYDFMVLANTESILSEIRVGTIPAKIKADIQALAKQVTAGIKWSDPIPMWDEQRLELTTESSPVFYLTRMLARIDVEYIPKTGTDDFFHLTSIRYYNYNISGLIVPQTANMTGTGADKVAARPTLPSDPGTQLGNSLEYTAIADNRRCKSQIYVFEAEKQGKYDDGDDKWINNPCLVVGGQYDADKDGDYGEEPITWYRIDFIKPTKEWLSLLRNFSYKVTITSVNGAGYSDPDIALNSVPFNIDAGVIDWNDGRMDEVLFDGTAYLSVDKHEMAFPRHEVTATLEDGSNVLHIKTDYTINGYPEDSGWKAEYYTDSDGTVPMTDPWLKLVNGPLVNKGTPTGTPDDPAAVTHFTFGENPGNINREAWVYITAGRLRYRVHVVQKLLSVELFEIIGNAEVPKDSMLFVIPHSENKAHTPRTFQVRWYPIDKPVTITHDTPIVWNPFASEWITGNPANNILPDPGAVGFIPSGSGMQEYAVTPPTVDDEDLHADPFYEKKSTYWFEVKNGEDSERKGINLYQVYYNIIVDTYKYKLDGKTYTMSVRSNTEWKITAIEEWLYNEDPTVNLRPSPTLLRLQTYDNLKVGTVGGPNINGESVAFTVVDQETDVHNNKWGTVYVTFESPTGKFPAQRVAMVFPPKGRVLLGLGMSQDVRAYNVAFPSSYHSQGANRMLTNPMIFGPSDESFIKVDDFRIIGYNSTGLSTPVPAINPESDWHTGYFKKWLNVHKPDIIAISYNIRFNAEECALLKRYLDNGGAVIAMYNGGNAGGQTAVKTFMEAMFPGNSFTTGYDGTDNMSDIRNWGGLPASGAILKLAEGDACADDPILNGPFGDVRGKYWGAHYYRSGILASAIRDEAHILSTAKCLWPSPNDSGHDDYAIMFRHKTLNLFFVGCDGFTASYYPWYEATGFDGEQCKDPFRVDERNNFMPAVRGSFNAEGVFVRPETPGEDVYNSFVFANAMAWALSVSNHIPPVGGY